MKICVFGNKNTTTALIRHLQAEGFDVSALVTLGQAAQSKVQISGADDRLAQFAAENGIEILAAEKYNLSTPHDQQMFDDAQFDIGLCTGWQRLIPPSVLRTFKFGVFGWHGSGFRFPNGRGRSPLNWSIRLGLDVIYHNCFQYDAGVDDGLVHETEALPIAAEEDIADVQRKAVAHIKASAVRVLRDAQAGHIPLTPQIGHPFITFPALNEASGFLALNLLTRSDAINITRSCSRPFPGAYVKTAAGGRLRIWKLAASDEAPLAAGEAGIKGGRLRLGFLGGTAVSTDFEVLDAAGVTEGAVFPCE